ncbi:MAG: DMT family transporter [Candidatus Aramenus sulfurataquae]|uniref:DMT family transporter n=2 Tax=Candidatus Aramenus sulfurataquae TaxID=1326980 RepID=A0A0F2LPE9_9CREN|nr:DMT family transporter [Candidatus Aramenus sulfurataquae]
MSSLKGYLSILGVVVVWGLSFPLSKLALYFMSPFVLTFIRFLVGGVVLLAYARGMVIGVKEAINAILNMGLFVILLNIAINLSTNPALTSVLIYTQPIFVIVLLRLMHERLSLLQIAGTVIAFAGIFISVDSTSFSVGSLVAVVGAIIWAIGTIYFRRNLMRTDVIKLNAFSSLFSTVFVVPFLPASYSFSLNGLPYALLVALLAQALGFIFWFTAVKSLGPLNSSTLAIMVPVSAYLFSFVILDDVPTPMEVLGSVLALGGVLLSQLGVNREVK